MKWSFIVFFAIFLGVVAVGGYVWFRVRKKVRDFSRMAFGTTDLIAGLKSVETETETTPRSLNGCDSILLPQILEDFPDFDPALAKTYARDALRAHLADKHELYIHNVVFARYERSNVVKTIVMQAALQYRENGRMQQKRYNLNYAYTVQGEGGDHTAAANCPNCGGVIAFGQTHCTYCGSLLVGVMKGAWEVTEIREG